MKQKLFSMLALLLMAATGAMAQTTYTVAGSNAAMFGSTWDATYTANDMTKNGDGTYSITYTNVNLTDNVQYKVVKDHSWDEAYPETNRVINIAKAGTYTMTIHFNPTTHEVYETMPYAITLADGTEDADNWTISPASAAEGETVTITYTGTKRVKSVTAVKVAEAPSVTEVTTFSELQTALSAGKDVKLMNDIVCTAEINITSNEPLTIDGNGKKLSTTSAIRAFKVGSSATVAFKNLTLTGFVSGGGPAINNSGKIVLDGCTISNCHVNNSNGGGAIENKGKLYAINTTFSGNYSGEIGGAINNYMGSLYMSGCTFTNNYTTRSNAFYGGAIGINGGSEVRLINCSFSENKYGTNTGTSDIGVYSNPTNYTIAGCTGANIASGDGDITTIASGTATLDYSDLSNISFTYTPITVMWKYDDITGSGNSFTKDGVTITANYVDFDHKDFNDDGTFTTTLGNFTKIEVSGGNCGASGTGWSGDSAKKTWTGNASSVSFSGDIRGMDNTKFVFTIEPTN